MYLDNKLVLLAGATGLAGANVMCDLLQHYPTIRIRACAGSQTRPFIQHERVEYVEADLTSSSDCRRAAQGCDCAIMAASANAGGATVSTTEPWKQVSDNLVMNTRLLEAFAFHRLQRVVCLGSITLYQEFGGNIKEDELDLNRDPFPAYFGIGWVVRCIEKLCRFWHEKMGIEIIMVRSANIFGPYAKFDPQTSTFIPAIIRKAVDRIDPFEVWGTPNVTRDVIYAEDFARAVVLLLDNTEIKFDVFNVGSGERTTVGDVVNWALKYAGHQPARIVYQSGKPSTNKFRAVDSTKVRRATGWAPRYTIEEGIMKTTQWWVENRNWWKR